MEDFMKSLIAVICILGMISLVAGLTIKAADTDTLSATVTPTNISLTITTDKSTAYGTVNLGNCSSTPSSMAETANNNGSLAETFDIQTTNATDGTNWTVGTAAGTNIYTHSFATNTAFTWQLLDAVDSYETASSSVATSGNLNIYTRICVPTGTAGDYSSKNITVTMRATQAP